MGICFAFFLEEHRHGAWGPVERVGSLEGETIHRRDLSSFRTVVLRGPSSRSPAALCYRLFDDGPLRWPSRPIDDVHPDHVEFTVIRNGPPSFGAWIGLDDLELPTWPDRTVLVGTRVAIADAPRFEGGELLSPRELLGDLQARATSVATEALDYRGALRHVLYRPSHDGKLPVTWRVPLLDVGRPLWEAGFEALASLDEPGRYRLITGTA